MKRFTTFFVFTENTFGDLSSDAGLLLIKEFVSKLGIDKLFGQSFKTNNSALFRHHADKANLLQMNI